MKTYKIWEVQENLNKKPQLKFKTKTKFGNAIAKYYDGYINFIHEDKGYDLDYYANELNDLNREWTLVQTPVDFIETTRAFYMGKTIKVEVWDRVYYYTKENDNSTRLIDNYGNAITADTIINGKWYIEE